MVLFDEFDAVGRSRDDATEHGELKRVVNAFLQMLDRFTGRSVVVAATNFEQSLDPALWRRFDEIVRFERPCRTQVEQLLRKQCGRRLPENLDLAAVVRDLEGASHAEVERAALDALEAGRPGRACPPGQRGLRAVAGQLPAAPAGHGGAAARAPAVCRWG